MKIQRLLASHKWVEWTRWFEETSWIFLMELPSWWILAIWAKIEKTKGTLFSWTFKVDESKVPLFLPCFAPKPRYGHKKWHFANIFTSCCKWPMYVLLWRRAEWLKLSWYVSGLGSILHLIKNSFNLFNIQNVKTVFTFCSIRTMWSHTGCDVYELNFLLPSMSARLIQSWLYQWWKPYI